jgi:hypothetical protein
MVADKYQLERLLDEGGMGSIWLATNLDLDASAALLSPLVIAETASSPSCSAIESSLRGRATNPTFASCWSVSRDIRSRLAQRKLLDANPQWAAGEDGSSRPPSRLREVDLGAHAPSTEHGASHLR